MQAALLLLLHCNPACQADQQTQRHAEVAVCEVGAVQVTQVTFVQLPPMSSQPIPSFPRTCLLGGANR
jgi:hypothetical protein